MNEEIKEVTEEVTEPVENTEEVVEEVTTEDQIEGVGDVDEEIQDTFNTDGFDELNEDGEIENVYEEN